MTKIFLPKPLYHLLLIIILGIIGYSNTLSVPFVFDDDINIVRNPIIKNIDYYLSPSKAKRYNGPTEYPMFINRYVGSLTFALNYKIHGLDVTGYHLVNILIHLINSLLIYWFLHLIFLTLASGAGGYNPLFLKHGSTVALFASLLFVTHPIQIQAVTYIVQRFTSLATMFYLFSMIMYIKARLIFIADNNNHGGKISIRALIYFLTALLAAVMAIKSKEIALTLPFFIVLYDWYFLQDLEGGWLKKHGLMVGGIGCLLVVAVFFFYLGKDPFSSLLAGYGSRDFTLVERLLTESRVIIFYISLLILPLPARLNLGHDFVISQSLLAPASTIFSVIALALLFSFAVFLARRNRLLSFGIIWFFGNLAIESTFVPLEIIFEHRLYLPSLGIFLAVSALLVMVIERCRQKWVGSAVFLSVIITAMVFTGTTYSRNNVWNDELILWQDVVSKSPRKARGYHQLANVQNEKGNRDLALKYYMKAVSVDPSYAPSYYNLGIIYYGKGLPGEAIKYYMKAINVDPSDFASYYNLGTVYSGLGLTDMSIKAYRNAIKINPSHADAYNNLGIALFDKGRMDESIKAYRNAINIEPSHANAYSNLGEAFLAKGLIAESIKACRNAINLNPSLSSAHTLLSIAYSKKNTTGQVKSRRKGE